ncbi:MAG: hypothetical protein OYG31_01165 [Candidatus Kaiserbacteria bacterium]|nr:hypothetical protein [Candidatus Kaiserbacteria bacterium]
MNSFASRIQSLFTRRQNPGDRVTRTVGTLSDEEMSRRIKRAAKHTVKEYGDVIAKLSRE